MIKDTYEISLWQDKLNSTGKYYDEEKVVIIGSDTMTAPCRAVEPKLVENVNGTNTLTFKLYYTYIDPETGAREDNPYIKLLTNERRVKCKWKEKWYEFVIKNIQEDSSGKSIAYTCKDLYINELSKTGFNLEFDNELENNQGTVKELGEKILEGTDWKVGDSDIIQQTLEEPLYAVTVTQAVLEKFGKDDIVLIPYSTYENRKGDKTFVQFFYEAGIKNSEGYSKYSDNGSNLLVGLDCQYLEKPKDNALVNPVEDFWNSLDVENASLTNWRADRLVREPLQEYSALVDRYCEVYQKGDNVHDRLYKYVTTEYSDPTVVQNLVVNSKEFKDTNGWIGEGLTWALFPPFNNDTILKDYNATTYLKVTGGNQVFNTGIQKSSMYLENGFQKGEKYIFRVKARKNSEDGKSPTITSIDNAYKFDPVICSYKIVNGRYDISNATKYLDFQYKNEEQVMVAYSEKFIDGWKEYQLVCTNSITREAINTTNMGLFLIPHSTCWIEEVQLFKEEYGEKKIKDETGETITTNVRINPGDIDTQSVAKLVYRYFNPKTQIDPDNIEFEYSGNTDQTPKGYSLVYPKNGGDYSYEKIRSINGKQSNRFNLLQSLAETFECWVRFEIEHDQSTGKILRGVDGAPKKNVYFVKEVGREVGYGFIYGIDLKTISRTIDSNQLTTKIIVVPNVNEYAKNGVCEIAQSKHNPAKENFIINFDYFVNQGLLDGSELNRDLWQSPTPVTSTIGYYPELKRLNTLYYNSVEITSVKKTELDKQKSMLSLYRQYVTADDEQITELKSEITQLAGANDYNETAVKEYIAKNPDYQKLISTFTALKTLEKAKEGHQAIVDSLGRSVNALTARLDKEDKDQKGWRDELEALHKKFNSRYARFIQEGSWTSKDYLDENLYYLDAKSVAYTSSRPKISYNISAIRLSALEEFRGKIFNIGDISFIQDKEFFGFDENGNPYKEKVLISEITSNFDSPEKDTFKIQNYKTQFEDLFQRITATTQSLQYTTGDYQRAANIVESNGVINPETLQLSIARNNNLVYSSQNNTIVQDATGILLVDETNPSQQTKITSNGLFITVDGGLTWKNAIRGEGIATQYLTSGAINTENITILDGANTAFRWNSYGINAYQTIWNTDQPPKKAGYNPNTFVRFDQYGIYGIQNSSSDSKEYVPTNEKAIWENANFGLTWKGFFLKNKSRNGTVEISSENDITVNEGDISRIQIGGIGTKEVYGKTSDTKPVEGKKYYKKNEDETSYTEVTDILENDNPSEKGYYEIFEGTAYGIRIKGEKGATVMETSDNGKLWLKDSLYLGDGSNSSVRIGYLLDTKPDDASVRAVINANNNFIVYQDGTMVAQGGQFSGTITAAKLGTSNTYIDSNGLTFINSGLYAYDYVLTLDEVKVQDKIYYRKNEDGSYEIEEDTSKLEKPFENGLYERKEKLSFEGGNLHISGDISGSTGTFSGDISATSGTIGGFQINSDSLTSLAKDEDTPNITLNGKDGKIIAKNIELGIGATIKDYIKLGGNTWLRNATSNNKNFLEVKDGAVDSDDSNVKISISDDCLMKLGDLLLDGNSSKIEGKNWNITPDTATFERVIAKGGIIENIVFKNSTVQAAGGQMIFKPSARGIFSNNEKTFTLDENSNNVFSVGDYVLLSVGSKPSITTKIVSMTERMVKPIVITLDLSQEENLPEGEASLTKLAGTVEQGEGEGKSTILTEDLLIGINPDSPSSEDVDGKDSHTNLYREGITFIRPTLETNGISYENEPLLFLGNLNNLGKTSDNITGYGLYGENVFLQGSLTTKIPTSGDSNTYAGINTISKVEASNEGISGKIVFWAGANGNNEASITNAPFYVTDKGDLFAQKGRFEGAIISKSEIQGADIYAARIHGWEGNESGALSIYDTDRGILFKTVLENNSEVTTLALGTRRFSYSDKNFIELSKNNALATFIGEYKTSVSDGAPYLKIGGQTIEGRLQQGEDTISVSSIELLNKEIDVKVGEISVLNFTSSEIASSADLFSTDKNVLFGEETAHSLKYQSMSNGYNLYVS